jgi:peptidoglycan/xylan/chitin deacetylase (PgdA/CDA1 family)
MPGQLKTGLASLCTWTGVDRLTGALLRARHVPLIIGYHRVVHDFADESQTAIPSLLISRNMLERHLDWLGRHFRFASLDEIGETLAEGAPFREPTVAITFDDGYSDVYENALPILKSKGIPATVFVVTDLIGTEQLPLHDRLYVLLRWAYSGMGRDPEALKRVLAALKLETIPAFEGDWTPLPATRHLLLNLSQNEIEAVITHLMNETRSEGEGAGPRPLTWDMVSRMHRMGLTIGSHTRTHALLTRERKTRLQDETAGSRRDLEARLGIGITHFAYPDGRFDPTAVDAVHAAGYRFAYTTCRHRDPRHPLLSIPRRLFWERSCVDGRGTFSPAIMSCSVHGVFDLVARCAQDHGGRGRNSSRAGERPHADPPSREKQPRPAA